MCRFVGIVVFKGKVEEVETFDNEESAAAYIDERRRKYGMRGSSESLMWDTNLQLPVRIASA